MPCHSGKLGILTFPAYDGCVQSEVISENKYPVSVHRHRAKAGSFCCFEGILFSGNHLKTCQVISENESHCSFA